MTEAIRTYKKMDDFERDSVLRIQNFKHAVAEQKSQDKMKNPALKDGVSKQAQTSKKLMVD